MKSVNPQLRYRTFWLLIGYALIVLVVYLSLVSDPVELDTGLPYQDKLLHVLAYFSLTFWFMQVYHVRQHALFWVVFFLCLGLFLELMQGLEPARYSETADMVANVLGVVLALLLSRTRLRFLLVGLERYLGR